MDAIPIAVSNSKTIIALSKIPDVSNKGKPSTVSLRTRSLGMRKPLITSISSGFKDNSHLSFYCNANGGIQISNDHPNKMKSENSKKKESKKLKRLREMRKDLFALSQSANEYNLDPPSMEAIDLLLNRLEQLQIETEGAINERKSEDCKHDDTSSSSSESSDSEREDRRHQALKTPKTQFNNTSIESETELSRIEVCTGSKCKKSGSISVMEALTTAEEIKYPVIGSKCMGKCKTAPNVKVITSSTSITDVNTMVETLLAKNSV